MDKQSVMLGGGRLLGFFSLLMLLTLNASNGKDLLDVIVPYVEAQTEALNVSE
jgi:hypothetical protein